MLRRRGDASISARILLVASYMRNAIRALPAIALCTTIACGTDKAPSTTGSRYGGVFNMNETEVLRSIFPLTMTQASAYRIASQIYQGLVCFDPGDLSIQPCLADRWEVDPTGTQFTFHLREGVYFHDDPVFPEGRGRAVTVEDVTRCFNAICRRGVGDQVFWLFQDRVEGANAAYALPPGESEPSVSGIQALDRSTVRITLAHPSPNFLQIIAHSGCWIYPQELVDTYGGDLMQHAIGTGPFRLKVARPGESIVLERNARYWDHDASGQQLPYLDGVRVTLVQDKDREIDEFLRGRLSMVLDVSLSRVDVLADSVDNTGKPRFQTRSVPALAVQFFGLNATKPPFNDVRVRRAVAMAIDRRVLVDSVLRSLAVEADHGIVAPGLSGYPYELVPGVPYDPEGARRLLAEAGYPDGKGFPRLQLQINTGGFGYVRVAGEVQNMLQRELHLAVSVSVMSAKQHYERIESGDALFWREGWIADHPDPENFLALLYGKNAVADTSLSASLNNTRYASPQFDSLFTAALQTTDEGERLRRLAMAERVAMRDVPVIPLYHQRFTVLSQPWVHDLQVNAIEYLFLGRVWFDRSAG